jgi:hypothetical protein
MGQIETEGVNESGVTHWKYWAALPLVLLLLLLAATSGRIDILDDEVLMLNAAEAPVAQTLHAFATGVGQHEHPPFADLLLHAWWSVAPGSLFWLRLPFILCYVAAFALLVLLAERLAGGRAAVVLAWLALLSPFGFYFGHLLGWYNVALLLVAALTYCYARWLEGNSPAWAAGAWVAALALFYTNYFGWVLVGLLALDAALFRDRKRLRAWAESGAALLLLALAFAPLWAAMIYLQQHPQAKVEGSKLAAYIFDMYALLVSESFAPWFFAVGVPVALLCAACYLLTLLGTRGLPRRLMVYFLVSTGLLALIGSINTKRLPFLMGWFFLPLAVALAQKTKPRLRAGLAAAVAVVFAVGWFGTIRGGYYASTHFVDDWKDAVALGMQEHARGGALVYDHPVAAYYLSRACAQSSAKYQAMDVHPACGIAAAQQWFADGHAGERVVALRGVQYGLSQDPGDSYLEQNCKLESEQHYTRDTAAAMKRRLFPTQREPEWRVREIVYDCSAK